MSLTLDQLIQVGHGVIGIKYYGKGIGAILFYDYLLTLEDEVAYVWSGEKSWGFWLFIFNRYFPMIYQFWEIGLALTPHFTKVSSAPVGITLDFINDRGAIRTVTQICDKTAWFSLLMLVVCTTSAQVLLTARLSALAMKNIHITIGFAFITVSQLVLGICLVVLAARKGAQQILSIPLDAYRICLAVRHRTLEIAYTSVSLFYDCSAFLSTIYFATQKKTQGLKVSAILEAMVEDATRYFLLIFAAHLSFEMVLAVGPESIQLLPSPGVIVYLPVMASRLMLSLRKAAHSQRVAWTLGEPSVTSAGFHDMSFPHPQKGPHGKEDEIPLDVYPES